MTDLENKICEILSEMTVQCSCKVGTCHENDKTVNCKVAVSRRIIKIFDKVIAEANKETAKYLEWALAQIDNNFAETGKIGFAEAIVYKAAKSHVESLEG